MDYSSLSCWQMTNEFDIAWWGTADCSRRSHVPIILNGSAPTGSIGYGWRDIIQVWRLQIESFQRDRLQFWESPQEKLISFIHTPVLTFDPWWPTSHWPQRADRRRKCSLQRVGGSVLTWRLTSDLQRESIVSWAQQTTMLLSVKTLVLGNHRAGSSCEDLEKSGPEASKCFVPSWRSCVLCSIDECLFRLEDIPWIIYPVRGPSIWAAQGDSDDTLIFQNLSSFSLTDPSLLLPFRIECFIWCWSERVFKNTGHHQQNGC